MPDPTSEAVAATDPTSEAVAGFVVATAGHVDHGKSALVRALTGIEPDRWDEERRRGMTIGLGFAWTRLPSGADAAFVDVPGHERFVTTMLSGVGPAPAVMFVVAADEGWSAQSEEHLAAIDALGVRHGLLVITKTDRTGPEAAGARALDRIATTSLGPAVRRWVGVSARTGAGIATLRSELDRVLAGLPAPDPAAPVRLWVDRAFTVTGAGTVVTGTLGAGRITVGDRFDVDPGDRSAVVRGLHSEDVPTGAVTPTRRVAVNLRGVGHGTLRRGDALVTPGGYVVTAEIDVIADGGDAGERAGRMTVAHIGSAAVPARVRVLADPVLRLRLDRPLPLHVGDRLLLRDPSRMRGIVGVDVADVAPPPLHRRRAAVARAGDLLSGAGADAELRRRGVVDAGWLRAAGHAAPPTGAERIGRWWCSREQLTDWRRAAARRLAAAPDGEVGLGVLRQELDVPETDLLVAALAGDPEVVVAGARARLRGAIPARSDALRSLVDRLRADPFDAPDGGELRELAVPPGELARACAEGDVVQLARGVYVGPAAIEEATARLRVIEAPFTAGAAAAALGVSRRVAIPLLERLDRLRVTRRVEGDRRVTA